MLYYENSANSINDVDSLQFPFETKLSKANISCNCSIFDLNFCLVGLPICHKSIEKPAARVADEQASNVRCCGVDCCRGYNTDSFLYKGGRFGIQRAL